MCARYVLVESSPERRVGHNLIVSVFLVQLACRARSPHSSLLHRCARLDSDPEYCSVGDVSSLFPPISGRLCLTWLVLSLLLLSTVAVSLSLPPPSQPVPVACLLVSMPARPDKGGPALLAPRFPSVAAYGGSCLAATEIRLLEMELGLT